MTNETLNEPAKMQNHLLDCPFCWGVCALATVKYRESTVREQGWNQDTFHYVNCIKCGAGNCGLVGHRSPAEAVKAWNTRATPKAMEGETPELETFYAWSDGDNSKRECVSASTARRLQRELNEVMQWRDQYGEDAVGFAKQVTELTQQLNEARAELESLRNAVFNLGGHLPGVSQEEQLAAVKQQVEELIADKILFATQLQELAEIIIGQPGTVAHFRSVKEELLSIVAQTKAP